MGYSTATLNTYQACGLCSYAKPLTLTSLLADVE